MSVISPVQSHDREGSAVRTKNRIDSKRQDFNGIGMTWEEPRKLAVGRGEWRRSVAQCVFDTGLFRSGHRSTDLKCTASTTTTTDRVSTLKTLFSVEHTVVQAVHVVYKFGWTCFNRVHSGLCCR